MIHVLPLCKKLFWLPAYRKKFNFWLTPNHLSLSVANLLLWCYFTSLPDKYPTVLLRKILSVSYPRQACWQIYGLICCSFFHSTGIFSPGVPYSAFPPQLKYTFSVNTSLTSSVFWALYGPISHIHILIVVLNFELQIICVSITSYFSWYHVYTSLMSIKLYCNHFFILYVPTRCQTSLRRVYIYLFYFIISRTSHMFSTW